MSRPFRILCADDNELDVERVQRLLPALARRCGRPMELGRACDGVTLLERLEACGAPPLPDLLLLDLNMPRLDGHGCLRAIAERAARDAVWDPARDPARDPVRDRMRVVVVTTSMRAHDRDEAIRAGAFGYVVKPVSLEVLVGFVGQVPSEDGAHR